MAHGRRPARLACTSGIPAPSAANRPGFCLSRTSPQSISHPHSGQRGLVSPELRAQLAAEAFQMVVEGLSNIRRHTQAAQAKIEVSLRHDCLHLRIENDRADEPWATFAPRSIAERAAALGGEASVRTDDHGATVVTVEVPL